VSTIVACFLAASATGEGRGAGATDPYAGLRPFAGDIHVHTGLAIYQVLDPNQPHAIGTPDEVLDAAESRGLDFVVITDHSNNINDPRGVHWREDHGALFTLPDGTRTPSEWAYAQANVARHNKPGRFLAFLGLEYTRGNTETGAPGHKLGIFPGDPLPGYCSNFPHNAGDCLTGADFFQFVKDHGGLAVAAHPCSLVTWGPSDWSETDPVMNSMELTGGKCEFGANGYNDVLLNRGLRIGARGSSDSHHFEVGTNDKTICYARELSREAILEAMRANLCYFADLYPVTLKFSINGAPMGSDAIDGGSGLAVAASASTDWETDFDHMELIHDGKVIKRSECEDLEYDGCVLSAYVLSDTAGYYYVAVSNESGRRIAVSSPIWVRPGR